MSMFALLQGVKLTHDSPGIKVIFVKETSMKCESWIEDDFG